MPHKDVLGKKKDHNFFFYTDERHFNVSLIVGKTDTLAIHIFFLSQKMFMGWGRGRRGWRVSPNTKGEDSKIKKTKKSLYLKDINVHLSALIPHPFNLELFDSKRTERSEKLQLPLARINSSNNRLKIISDLHLYLQQFRRSIEMVIAWRMSASNTDRHSSAAIPPEGRFGRSAN